MEASDVRRVDNTGHHSNSLGCLETAGCFPIPPKPLPFHSSMNLAGAPHILGKAPAHQHTFLLDLQTGRIWDMTCDSENKVRFQAVQVDGLDVKKQ
jgi:hypothetical protein